MPFSMRGQQAELKCGYQVAARLGAWSLADDRFEAASASDVNDVWLSSGSLSLWLHLGNKRWVWRDVQVADTDTPFVVIVAGKPDVRDA